MCVAKGGHFITQQWKKNLKSALEMYITKN